jgi:hypothetical protein
MGTFIWAGINLAKESEPGCSSKTGCYGWTRRCRRARSLLSVPKLGRDFSWTLDGVSGAGDVELKKLIAQPVSAWLQ